MAAMMHRCGLGELIFILIPSYKLDTSNINFRTRVCVGAFAVKICEFILSLLVPLPSFLRRRRTQAVLRRIVNEVIEKKLAEKLNEGKPKDLLDLILPNATTREAIIHTVTFLSAGHETSSSSLSLIFATVSSRPDVIQRLRQEYKDAIAKHGSLATWEAVNQLTYTMAVIQETMRLCSVIVGLARRISVNDDYIPMDGRDPIFIPAGTMIEVNVAALHRHPKYWDKPDTFVPERFLEGTPESDADLKLRGGKPHAFYYVPFSIGSANCIGQRFALVETQVILATVVGVSMTSAWLLGRIYARDITK
ncbi:hypothetical protein AC1031_010104 [Aphanomyces cochlioides]|nr:hypothetical protein AC1031_010104 [Aphanomyces cochlioides]